MPNDNAQAILARIAYATVATVDAVGNPWNAPVYVAYDSEFNFYWGSHVGSQHSKNILATGKVFLAIYDSTAMPGTREGVYVRASCREVSDPKEVEFAHTLIQKRRAPIPYWKLEKLRAADSPIRLYKASPEQFWMNGDTVINDTYVDIRVEVEG